MSEAGRGGARVSEPLERRYRWLLRAYPAPYRAARGDELVGTLLDLARPGQRRPSVRQAGAIVLCGLRVRTGVARPRTRQDIWHGALYLAVLFLLAASTVDMLAESVLRADRIVLNGGLSPRWYQDLRYPLVALVLATALAAAVRARWVATVALLAVALVLGYWARSQLRFAGLDLQPLLALLFSLPQVRWRTAAAPRRRGLLALAVVAVLAVPTQLPELFGPGSWTRILWSGQILLLLAVIVGCLLWSVVDARLGIAVGCAMLAYPVLSLDSLAAVAVGGGYPPEILTAAVVNAVVSTTAAVVPLLAGTLLARRQARL